MVLRDLNFYDIQSTRSYPLDDSATEISDDGDRIPSNLLVDAQIKFPRVVGEYLWISGITVNENLVTLTFLATDNAAAQPGHLSSISAGGFTPIAAITLTKANLVENRHYPISPLYPEVGGWVVFGEGIRTNFAGLFSDPGQTILAPQAARFHRGLPIPSLGKINRLTALTGIITVLGGREVEVVKETISIDGCLQDAMVIRLVDEFNRNVYQALLGPCDGRPETNTCTKPGVEFLNTIGPDCDGNINIEYRSVDDDCIIVTQNESCGGEVLDYCLGLGDACVIKNNFDPTPPIDQCDVDEITSSSISSSSSSRSSESLSSESVSSVSSVPLVCAEFPYIDDFDDSVAQDFEIKIGDFEIHQQDSPQESLGSYESFSSKSLSLSSSSSSLVPVEYTDEGLRTIDRAYASVQLDRRNVSVWNNCAMDESPDGSLSKRIKTDVRMTAAGVKRNGGIIVNYHTVEAGGIHDEYYYVEIDISTASLRIRRFTGLSFTAPIVEASPIPMAVGDWYRLEVEVTAGVGSSVDIKVTMTGITDDSIGATFTLNTNQYLPADGLHGLGTDQAQSQFSYFEIDEL